MDNSGYLASERRAAVVIFAFLQADCRDPYYENELRSLGKNLNLPRESGLDGDIETDGNLQSSNRPQAELQWPRGHGDAGALHAVAEELREIAAQIEHNVVVRATQNLSRNIRTCQSEQWEYHLAYEVEKAMKQGVGFENLPQERVMVALTLTLVERVCKQAPQLLSSLFETALCFICHARAR
ncbi:BH3 interacting domain death agonist isoform 1-T2 [Odontesthes bonariensis]|uniref:BH3 interacting domain death agonist n=1 Tax=Odontesthes bonariensis TaxID=219752 RepID=UPI003F58BCB4